MGQTPVVVLDTNVLVSAVGWRGPELRLLTRCESRDLQLAISPALLEEVARVLRYPKLRLAPETIAAFERTLLAHAVLVHPSERLRIIHEDPDDDRILECAVAAEASWIVSGDRHLLQLGSYRGIPITNAGDALRGLALA